MTSFSPAVSIIIVNWNGERFLQACIKSILKINYPKNKIEIIVIDNNSADYSVEKAKTIYSKIRIFKNNKNEGFAKGNNIGIKLAKFSHIVLLNNDTEVSKQWLRNLVSSLDLKNKVGGAIPKTVYYKNPEIINTAGIMLRRNRTWPMIERGINEKDHGQYNKKELVDGFSGVSVLLHKKMLDEVGLFDEKFFMYFEDVDLSWRAKKKGWKFMYAPSAIVYHHHSATTKKIPNLFNYYVSRNRLFVVTKNGSIFLLILTFIDFIKRILLHILCLLQSLPHKKSVSRNLQEIKIDISIIISYCLHIPYLLLSRIKFL